MRNQSKESNLLSTYYGTGNVGGNEGGPNELRTKIMDFVQPFPMGIYISGASHYMLILNKYTVHICVNDNYPVWPLRYYMKSNIMKKYHRQHNSGRHGKRKKKECIRRSICAVSSFKGQRTGVSWRSHPHQSCSARKPKRKKKYNILKSRRTS